MITVRIDYQSSLQVNMPENDEAIIALTETYVAYESALPPANQLALPPLATMQDLLAQAQTAVSQAGAGERQRAQAAEQFELALAAAQDQLDLALSHLALRHRHRKAMLENWGFDTVSTSKGVTVHLPNRISRWVQLMIDYVAYESSLPVEEQLAQPPLAEMAALKERVVTNYFQRNQGRDQRMANNEIRRKVAAKLYQLLQAAAVNLVIFRHDGQITMGLRAWGFNVTAVTATSDETTPTAPAPPAVETVSALDGQATVETGTDETETAAAVSRNGVSLRPAPSTN